jgi:hypothetical protein
MGYTAPPVITVGQQPPDLSCGRTSYRPIPMYYVALRPSLVDTSGTNQTTLLQLNAYLGIHTLRLLQINAGHKTHRLCQWNLCPNGVRKKPPISVSGVRVV